MINKIFITLLILTIGEGVFSQNDNIKAIFIYNFTKYIQWPSNNAFEPFTIGIFGNNKVYNILKQITTNKQNGNNTIVVKRIEKIKDINNNNIVFIGNSQLQSLNNILRLTDTCKTLVITENDKSIRKGVGINFIIKNKQQRFELHSSIIKKHSLIINPILENIAVEKEQKRISAKKHLLHLDI